ncbi:hypothetical protein V6N13_005005 [Hibiscus sabdariffa]
MLQAAWGGDKKVRLEGSYMDNPVNPIRCKEFMIPGCCRWDERKVEQIFSPEDGRRILDCPIARDNEDKVTEDIVDSIPCAREKKWKKPGSGVIKINVDGAWHATTRTAAIGIIARDNHGMMIVLGHDTQKQGAAE